MSAFPPLGTNAAAAAAALGRQSPSAQSQQSHLLAAAAASAPEHPSTPISVDHSLGLSTPPRGASPGGVLGAGTPAAASSLLLGSGATPANNGAAAAGAAGAAGNGNGEVSAAGAGAGAGAYTTTSTLGLPERDRILAAVRKLEKEKVEEVTDLIMVGFVFSFIF
jgi:hypothetical protein